MSLDATQALFYRLVTGAGPVSRAEVEACFLPSAELSAAERTAIYADMYLWRQVDALREDFPKLAAALGDEAFFALCDAYVRAHPSEHPDLGQLGRHLAGFTRAREPALGDLAALEWARAQVFFEAPTSIIGRGAFASLGEGLVAARLKLVPALRLLRLENDVLALWRRLESGQTAEAIVATPVAVAVWRVGFEVFHAALAPAEADALARAMGGAPIAEICAAFEAEEEPARVAFAALASWLDDGWVAGLDAED